MGATAPLWSSPLHFCMVSAFYPPDSFGGDAIFIQRLNRELLRRGHHVDVIHCADSFNALKGSTPTTFPELDGVTAHRLESGWGTLAPLAAHQTGRPLLHQRAIQDILRSKAFDVVHFHNISVFGPGVLELPVPDNTLKLYTAHEHWLVCPLSVLWKNDSELCQQPSCVSCVIRAGRPPQLWRNTNLLERASQSVDAFFAMTAASAQAHHDRGFTTDMQVLHGFVEPALPDDSPSPHARPYFLFSGRLEKYKGLQEVIPLFDGEGSHDLLILGTGGYEVELRKLAAGMSRVHFLGWHNTDDLGPYYRHARALIAPSLTYETFGIVVVEAMSEGTPVIARNLGAYPELINLSRGGLLFNDSHQLAAAIEQLAADDALRDKLGQAARSAFQTHWTPEVHVDRYLSSIDSLTGR